MTTRDAVRRLASTLKTLGDGQQTLYGLARGRVRITRSDSAAESPVAYEVNLENKADSLIAAIHSPEKAAAIAVALEEIYGQA